jgi:hypothetical protein
MKDSDVISLKEYFDSRLSSIEQSITVALAANEKRLDSMNEIKGAMKDQAALFAYSKDLEPIREDIRDLRETRAELKGKASQMSVIVAYVIAILGILLSVINILGRK